MAPTTFSTTAHHVRSLLASVVSSRNAEALPDQLSALGPLAANTRLRARDPAPANQPDPEKGIIHPGDINNTALFVLFGILGAAFVVTGIWFFFWARNGGFYFKKTDWDDYKTTVLRRRGPNGTLLSGATPSTQLGGGSVYKDVVDDDGRTTVTGSTEMTGITAGVSDIGAREHRRKKKEQRERAKERKREQRGEKGRKGERKVGEDGILIDEEAEAAAKEQLRHYRSERPARVGGLNKQSDGSAWDGSTNPASSTRETDIGESDVTSELIHNRERTPTSTPTKKATGGIRQVYSVSDKQVNRQSVSEKPKRDSRDAERIKSEARRLQERGRQHAATASGSGRRDFSYQQGSRDEESAVGSAHVPGSWTDSQVESDLGTKSYRHHIPGLSQTEVKDFADAPAKDYAEERRRKRASGQGYRRERN